MSEMEICEECGLPMPICIALAHYRTGVEALERGWARVAKESFMDAERLYDRYRTHGQSGGTELPHIKDS